MESKINVTKHKKNRTHCTKNKQMISLFNTFVGGLVEVGETRPSSGEICGLFGAILVGDLPRKK